MLHNRIKSKSGATILIALLFFLLCAMAGSIILAAGSASSGRLAGVKEEEQSYYTVTSAAKLIGAQIQEQNFGYYIRVPDSGLGSPTFNYVEGAEPDSDLKELLKNAATTVFNEGKEEVKFEDAVTIKPADTNTYPDLVKVTGSFLMKPNYDIEITLEIDGEKGDGMYTCKVSIPAIIEYRQKEVKGFENNIPYTQTETKLIWGKATIEKN